ncbi:MAG: SIMPL domain-containing protein [candidate division Zixibacteria bacterium]|nr:SIMPL domain-containing protein [candidate division Zixibacteria bacterium]
MKRVILIICFLICTSTVHAQNSTLKHINVRAQVEVTAKADRAVFSFTIEGTGSTLRMAVDAAKERISSITEGLMQIGLTENNFSTSHFGSRETKSKKAFIFTETGYKTSITVNVNIDNLSLLEEAILYLSEVKPDFFPRINFVLHNYEQLKINALEKAITKAKQKADLIAKIMNAELGKLLYFKESTHDSNQRSRISNMSSNMSYDFANSQTGGGGVFFSPDHKIILSVDAIIAVKGTSNN